MEIDYWIINTTHAAIRKRYPTQDQNRNMSFASNISNLIDRNTGGSLLSWFALMIIMFIWLANIHTHKKGCFVTLHIKMINSSFNAMETDYILRYIYLPHVDKATKIEVLCIVKAIHAMWNKDKNISKFKKKSLCISCFQGQLLEILKNRKVISLCISCVSAQLLVSDTGWSSLHSGSAPIAKRNKAL